MIAKPSPLQILSFELLESKYAFEVPEGDIEDMHSLFSEYQIDIDFVHNKQESDDREVDEIVVFTKVGVNHPEDNQSSLLPGHKIYVEAVGVFSINEHEGLTDGDRRNLSTYSTLNMMINNIRNIIYQTSNISPMNGYLLPPLDILDLFRQKNEQEEE